MFACLYIVLSMGRAVVCQLYISEKIRDSGLVANEQRSQHKLVMALCYARQMAVIEDCLV